MKRLILPTAEEDAEINRGIALDPDNPELDDDFFANARPTEEIFRELGLDMPRPVGRPPSEAPKAQVTIRLDPDVIAHFKGDNPKGWQTRVNAALRKAAGLD